MHVAITFYISASTIQKSIIRLLSRVNLMHNDFISARTTSQWIIKDEILFMNEELIFFCIQFFWIKNYDDALFFNLYYLICIKNSMSHNGIQSSFTYRSIGMANLTDMLLCWRGGWWKQLVVVRCINIHQHSHNNITVTTQM